MYILIMAVSHKLYTADKQVALVPSLFTITARTLLKSDTFKNELERYSAYVCNLLDQRYKPISQRIEHIPFLQSQPTNSMARGAKRKLVFASLNDDDVCNNNDACQSPTKKIKTSEDTNTIATITNEYISNDLQILPNAIVIKNYPFTQGSGAIFNMLEEQIKYNLQHHSKNSSITTAAAQLADEFITAINHASEDKKSLAYDVYNKKISEFPLGVSPLINEYTNLKLRQNNLVCIPSDIKLLSQKPLVHDSENNSCIFLIGRESDKLLLQTLSVDSRDNITSKTQELLCDVSPDLYTPLFVSCELNIVLGKENNTSDQAASLNLITWDLTTGKQLARISTGSDIQKDSELELIKTHSNRILIWNKTENIVISFDIKNEKCLLLHTPEDNVENQIIAVNYLPRMDSALIVCKNNNFYSVSISDHQKKTDNTFNIESDQYNSSYRLQDVALHKQNILILLHSNGIRSLITVYCLQTNKSLTSLSCEDNLFGVTLLAETHKNIVMISNNQEGYLFSFDNNTLKLQSKCSLPDGWQLIYSCKAYPEFISISDSEHAYRKSSSNKGIMIRHASLLGSIIENYKNHEQKHSYKHMALDYKAAANFSPEIVLIDKGERYLALVNTHNDATQAEEHRCFLITTLKPSNGASEVNNTCCK